MSPRRTRLEEHLERRLDAAAPEGAPWHVVDERHLPRAWRVANASGWTRAGLVWLLEPDLRAWRRWRGDGSAIVVHPARACQAVGQHLHGSGVSRWACRLGERFALHSTVIHEAAHAIESAGVHPTRPGRTEVDRWRQAMPSDMARLDSALADRDRWDSIGAAHGARWIRTAVHLHRRADREGLPSILEWVLSYRELPDVASVAEALADEVAAFAGEPIASVLERPEPDALTALLASNALDRAPAAGVGLAAAVANQPEINR